MKCDSLPTTGRTLVSSGARVPLVPGRTNRGKWSLLLILLALGAQGCACGPGHLSANGSAIAEPKSWEWMEPEDVVFKASHDPTIVELKDGRRLAVIYGGPDDAHRPTWSEVQNWKPGRPLRLTFAAAEGAVLYDPESQGLLPITTGLERHHPLDRLLERCLEMAPTTVDILQAYADNAKRWDGEIDRIYALVKEDQSLAKEVRKSLEMEQVAWIRFREAGLTTAGKVFSTLEGSMWSIEWARWCHALRREHAQSLLGWVYLIKLPRASLPECPGTEARQPR